MTLPRRSSSLLALLVAGALVAAVPAAARTGGRRPAGRFTFYGSGYGHGIGMSQYGALGLAKRGWSAERIVKHYYRGVDLVRQPPAEPTIRVGLLQNVASVRLRAAQGSFDLVLQSGTPLESAIPEGQSRIIEVTADRRFRVVRGDGTVVAEGGGPGDPLLGRRQGDGRIRVVEWGHDLGRGEIRFEIGTGLRTHVLAAVPVEEYVYGIAEVPSSWPVEALRAQAISARTYAYWRLAGSLRAGCACDVYATVADQNYIGWDKEAGADGNRWVAAVNDTAEHALLYQGQPIYAAYSSSSGGHTEDIEKVWPGAAPQPYLRGVCDPGDYVEVNPNRTWTADLDGGQITAALRPYTGDIGTVRGFTDFRLGVSGRVTYVRVVGTNRTKVVEGWDVRSGLSLKDTRFAINRNLNITGDIRLAYDRIKCRPGRAVTGQKRVKGGRYQVFAGGRMYEHDRRNAVVWLRGRVLRKYLGTGGHRSRLRLPYRYRAVKGGKKAWFDGGTITCLAGCRVRYR